jgi:hypothetical protein
VPVTGGTAKAEHTEPGAAERLGADALERIGAAVSLFDIRTLGRAARVNRAWCAAFGAALHSLPQRTAEARASLEHSELLRRPVCWAERRRATVLRLSSSRSSHGLLRDVCALHRSVVPAGLCECVDAVLRLCGLDAGGAPEPAAAAAAERADAPTAVRGPSEGEWRRVTAALSAARFELAPPLLVRALCPCPRTAPCAPCARLVPPKAGRARTRQRTAAPPLASSRRPPQLRLCSLHLPPPG